jgi:hypothetical protein
MLNGLLVKPPWIDKILLGAKTSELRGSRTRIRGPIALIQSGTGTVVGVCELVDVHGPLSLRELRRTTGRHQVPSARFQNGLPYRRTYAWRLRGAHRLRRPVPYAHPSGAVIWVNLAPRVVEAIRMQASEAASRRVSSREAGRRAPSRSAARV